MIPRPIIFSIYTVNMYITDTTRQGSWPQYFTCRDCHSWMVGIFLQFDWALIYNMILDCHCNMGSIQKMPGKRDVIFSLWTCSNWPGFIYWHRQPFFQQNAHPDGGLFVFGCIYTRWWFHIFFNKNSPRTFGKMNPFWLIYDDVITSLSLRFDRTSNLIGFNHCFWLYIPLVCIPLHWSNYSRWQGHLHIALWTQQGTQRWHSCETNHAARLKVS